MKADIINAQKALADLIKINSVEEPPLPGMLSVRAAPRSPLGSARKAP